jgi:hypothetical protein
MVEKMASSINENTCSIDWYNIYIYIRLVVLQWNAFVALASKFKSNFYYNQFEIHSFSVW